MKTSKTWVFLMLYNFDFSKTFSLKLNSKVLKQ